VKGKANVKAKFVEQMCYQEKMFWMWANVIFRLSEEEKTNFVSHTNTSHENINFFYTREYQMDVLTYHSVKMSLSLRKCLCVSIYQYFILTTLGES